MVSVRMQPCCAGTAPLPLAWVKDTQWRVRCDGERHRSVQHCALSVMVSCWRCHGSVAWSGRGWGHAVISITTDLLQARASGRNPETEKRSSQGNQPQRRCCPCSLLCQVPGWLMHMHNPILRRLRWCHLSTCWHATSWGQLGLQAYSYHESQPVLPVLLSGLVDASVPGLLQCVLVQRPWVTGGARTTPCPPPLSLPGWGGTPARALTSLRASSS